MLKKKYIPLYIVLLLVVALPPGLIADFRPSHKMAVDSIYVAIFITIISWPTVFFMPLKNINRALAAFNIFIGFPFLYMLLGWGAAIGTYGYTMNKLTGKYISKNVKVVSKESCHFPRRRYCTCNTKIRVSTDALMANGTICPDKLFWDSIDIGDDIKISGISSKYGFEINKFKKIN